MMMKILGNDTRDDIYIFLLVQSTSRCSVSWRFSDLLYFQSALSRCHALDLRDVSLMCKRGSSTTSERDGQ